MYHIKAKVAMAVLLTGAGGYLTWNILGRRYNLPPGPRSFPIVGSMLSMPKSEHMWVSFTMLKYIYGDIVKIKMGPTTTIVLNTAQLVRDAYIKDGLAFAGRPHINTLDLLSNDGEDIIGGPFGPRLQMQRKLAIGALRKFAHGDVLETHLQKAFECFCDEVDTAGYFVPSPMGFLVAYNIMSSMAFCKHLTSDDPFLGEMEQVFRDVEEIFTSPISFIYLFPSMKNFPSAMMRCVRRFAASFSRHIKKNYHEHLVNYNEGGTDTTRQTLAWIWQYLAAFPEVQTRAQEEIDRVIGIDGPITVNSREQLPYVDALVHEVMRIKPVVPLGVPHEVLNDTKLGGYDIPKGAMVMNNTWAIQHDEREWTDPEAFLPERWLDEHGQYHFQQNGFLPFSMGRRSCIGESFAKLELHMLTSMLLQRYTLEPRPGRRINLESIPGFFVRAPEQDIVVRKRM